MRNIGRTSLTVTAIMLMAAMASAQQDRSVNDRNASRSDQKNDQHQSVRDKAGDQSSREDLGARLFIGPQMLAQVQNQLTAAGFDAGTGNGSWTETTGNAVREFQRKRGIAATGKLDIGTLDALGIDLAQANTGAKSATSGTISGEGAPLYAGPAIMAQVMQKVQMKGGMMGDQQGQRYGSAEGSAGTQGQTSADAMSSQLQQAISRFQSSHGLGATGQLDLATLDAMGIDIRAASASGSDQNSNQGQSGQAGDQQGMMSSDMAMPICLSTDQVRRVQKALKDAGDDPGSVDGNWGPQTQKAVSSFQKNKDLPVTGNVNLETLHELGVATDLGSHGASGSSDRSGTHRQ